MKIYTKIRIDLKTGKTIEEESFEYDGPLALCYTEWVDAPSPNPASLAPNAPPSIAPIDASQAISKAISDLTTETGWANAKKGFSLGLGVDGPVGGILGGLLGYAYGAAKIGMQTADITASLAASISKDQNVTPEVAKAIAENAAKTVRETMNEGGEGEAEMIQLIKASGTDYTAMQLSSVLSQTMVDNNPTAIGRIVDAATSGAKSGKSVDQIVQEMTSANLFNNPNDSTIIKNALNSQYGKGTLFNEMAAKGVANPASTPGGWTAAIQSEGWGGSMTDQLGNLLTASAPDMTAFNSAMDEFRNVNTDIKFLHDMSELEGVTLSDEEKGFLETMRLNATTNLTNNVNEATLDLAESEIARMVSKGVLQGNIGSETMSKIYEASGKIVGEQSRNIESDVAKMGLGVLEQKKLNQMNLWGKELEADIASATVGTDKWKSVGMLELGKAEQGQKWNQGLIDTLTTMRGQDLSFKAAELGASTNLNLASQEMKAWKDAQDKQMWGNIGSALISAWA